MTPALPLGDDFSIFYALDMGHANVENVNVKKWTLAATALVHCVPCLPTADFTFTLHAVDMVVGIDFMFISFNI